MVHEKMNDDGTTSTLDDRSYDNHDYSRGVWYLILILFFQRCMSQYLAAPSPRADLEQVKFIRRLVDKVKYWKEVLDSQNDRECDTGREWCYGSALIAG